MLLKAWEGLWRDLFSMNKNYFQLAITTFLLMASLFIFLHNAQENHLNLQVKCADAAARYFSNQGYKNKRDDLRSLRVDYESHYNAEINKCLILISQTRYDYGDGGTIVVDLYDPIERKHYAELIGSMDCYPQASNLDKCRNNYGAIWFDGDDKNSPSFSMGDEVDVKSGQKKFMDYIQSFMTE